MQGIIYILTLGCAKNLVDSENMAALLTGKGYALTDEIEQAETIIINTCGFIESAKEESIQEILRAAELKKDGNLQYLIVTGCLAQRYTKELEKELPEVDAFLGTTSFHHVVQTLEKLKRGENATDIQPIIALLPENMPRKIMTQRHFAYLKIAEGCDNRCTYCIIPKLRGPYHSRPMEDIIQEAQELSKGGVKELIIIAQDTSKYGTDLYGEKKISQLLSELNKIEDLRWIRVLYSYPEDIDEEYIQTIARCSKVLPYFDIPIQHASNSVLKAMNRKITQEVIFGKLQLIRNTLPDAVIRTTLIAGFPGETQEDFLQLENFVKKANFDRLGVFAYSKEEGTPAAKMKGQIGSDEKEKRRERIMMIQQEISYKNNEAFIGSTQEVCIEDCLEEGLYEGRTWRDMIEIDGVVTVKSQKELTVGQMISVVITEADDYDLIGVSADEYAK